ncbi:hypothetical protein JW905_15055 [bacterium]|nr:hypothetical protein [candidate division CSSED10-310 bacterium]
MSDIRRQPETLDAVRPWWPAPREWLLLFVLFAIHVAVAWPFLRMPISIDVVRYIGPLADMPRPLRLTMRLLFKTIEQLTALDPQVLRGVNLLTHWFMSAIFWLFIRMRTNDGMAAFLAAMGLAAWSCSAETYGFIPQLGQPLWAAFLFAAMLLFDLPHPTVWSISAGLLCAGLSTISWEHGLFNFLVLVPLLLHRFKPRPVHLLLLAGILATGAAALCGTYLHTIMRYVMENLACLQPLRLAELVAVILGMLHVSPSAGFSFHPPTLVLMACAAGLYLLISERRAAFSWIDATLPATAGIMFTAGLLTNAFRLPAGMRNMNILGPKHVFFMSPVVALAAAALIAPACRLVRQRIDNTGLMVAVGCLACLAPLYGHEVRRSSVLNVQHVLDPLHCILDNVAEAEGELPPEALILIRLGRDMMTSPFHHLLSKEFIEPNVRYRLSRNDLTVEILSPGERQRLGKSPSLVLYLDVNNRGEVDGRTVQLTTTQGSAPASWIAAALSADGELPTGALVVVRLGQEIMASPFRAALHRQLVEPDVRHRLDRDDIEVVILTPGEKRGFETPPARQLYLDIDAEGRLMSGLRNRPMASTPQVVSGTRPAVGEH